jgi:hypothetical protein
MPNGDIVSGASDGVVRIFTESQDRVASAEDLKAFDDKVAAQTVPAQTLERLNLSDEESLNTPGLSAASLTTRYYRLLIRGNRHQSRRTEVRQERICCGGVRGQHNRGC